ncbi:hypothetical protein [Ferrimonas balearica]|uniref:hypothetical protein n=1 Tax=Ferrimonas balearica TaxID=44012 RepID=UPI001F24F0F6|nr:hypothetical protein [Ferrimonas balearica]MBY6095135.1 hypothetical protein [Ferrimonas balearica]
MEWYEALMAAIWLLSGWLSFTDIFPLWRESPRRWWARPECLLCLLSGPLAKNTINAIWRAP